MQNQTNKILKRQANKSDDTIRKVKKAKKDKMDLVRDKKISFVVNHGSSPSIHFHNSWYSEIYIYKTDDGEEKGYWRGLNKLSDQEREHFDKYIKDYFYYGKPNYDKGDDASECEMAFENGHSITRYKCIKEFL